MKVLATEALRKRDADRASPAVPNGRADRGNHRTIRAVARNAQTDPHRDCGPTCENVTRDLPLPLLIRPPGHPTRRDCNPDAKECDHPQASRGECHLHGRHRRHPRQDQDECGDPPPATKQDADLVAPTAQLSRHSGAHYSAPRGFGAGFISRARSE